MEEQRQLLRDLHAHLMELGTPANETEILRDAVEQMDELFMICVVGEFNAGKSTFINALLGDRWVEEGVLPTTASICVLKHGAEVSRQSQKDSYGATNTDIEELRLPVPWLDELAIVDTPGTNAVVVAHEQLTKRIVPRADLVLFVTSADRPFSESERAFLEMISGWGKKVVFIVNKIDILPDDEAVEHVKSFVANNGESLLGFPPLVMPVSAKKALRAKLAAPSFKTRSGGGNSTNSTSNCSGSQDVASELVERHHPELGAASQAWAESRFSDLEDLLRRTLTAEERVMAKLLSPLGVADQLVDAAAERVAERATVLESDLATVALAQANMESFTKEMARDLAFERLQVDKVLSATRRKGNEFFQERVTLTQAPALLMNPSRFKDDFLATVLDGVDDRIDEVINDVAVTVEERSRNQGRAILDFLGRRPGPHSEKMVGTLYDSSFDGVRFQVLSKLNDDVKGVMRSFNRDEEAGRLQELVQSSLLQAAAVEASAVTVGGLVAAHLIPDPTFGVATAGALAVMGTLVVPVHRRRMQSRFNKQIEKLRNELDDALEVRMEREVRKLSEKILESVAPFARFVKVEEEKNASTRETVRRTQSAIAKLKSRILRK